MIRYQQLEGGGFRAWIPLRADGWLASLPIPDNDTGGRRTAPAFAVTGPIGMLMFALGSAAVVALIVDPCFGRGPWCTSAADLGTSDLLGTGVELFFVLGIPLVAELEYRVARARRQTSLQLAVTPELVAAVHGPTVDFRAPLHDVEVYHNGVELVLFQTSTGQRVRFTTECAPAALDKLGRAVAEVRS